MTPSYKHQQQVNRLFINLTFHHSLKLHLSDIRAANLTRIHVVSRCHFSSIPIDYIILLFSPEAHVTQMIHAGVNNFVYEQIEIL